MSNATGSTEQSISQATTVTETVNV